METVEAIRDREKIDAMKNYLKEHSERDHLLFVLGINTGLKITELLHVKVHDVMSTDEIPKEFLQIPGSDKEIFLNPRVRATILRFVRMNQLHPDDYLFQSPKTKKPITRQQAYRILQQAAKAVGIEGKIGTNSLRKTFGFHAYKRGIAISLLQKYFNHATPSETLRYIGISKDEKIRTEIDVDL
ncbi:tyrosine-type recombinase/integrase [Staphylospora marina]|uniref:tyrosine-type recombinase/integrase n=1 Tax=Staphylospora marina TaxID=2490858 RepID=UPI000F5BB700|nr:tyrosine-type recombinase/integrase [Staphylospora marina]